MQAETRQLPGNHPAGTAQASGLEGVMAADTRLSDVDGEIGRLIIAGEDVERLAGQQRFSSVCAALWREAGANTPSDLEAALGAAREAAWRRRADWSVALDAADGMEALRGAVGMLASSLDDDVDAVQLTGATAVFAGAWSRHRAGEASLAPDPGLDHATDYLRMATGHAPGAALSAAIDAYLVTVMDHGMNASTFTARVIASTGSDMVSAITGAVGALKGPLHGGAPGPVLDMLDAIGHPEAAAAWVTGELDAQRRIMGMGHRIYRVRDPRAAVLEAAIGRLERAGVAGNRMALARAVEREAERQLAERYPDRSLKANVEFYTAVLLEAVGLPRTAFSPTFAVGRVAGWCAHVIEQRRTGRLIRPGSRYVGIAPA